MTTYDKSRPGLKITEVGTPDPALLRQWAEAPENTTCWGLDRAADELERLSLSLSEASRKIETDARIAVDGDILGALEILIGDRDRARRNAEDTETARLILLGDVRAAKRAYDDEAAIVNRVWKALGVSRYEDAGGKAIDEIVKARCDYAELTVAMLRALRAWDMLDTAADGPYWKREIDKVLAKEFQMGTQPVRKLASGIPKPTAVVGVRGRRKFGD